VLKKDFLLTSLLVIAVSANVCPLVVKTEYAKAYAVCENQMLSVESDGEWVYQGAKLRIVGDPNISPRAGIVFTFTDDCRSDAYCLVYRDLSGWHHYERLWVVGQGCLP